MGLKGFVRILDKASMKCAMASGSIVLKQVNT